MWHLGLRLAAGGTYDLGTLKLLPQIDMPASLTARILASTTGTNSLYIGMALKGLEYSPDRNALFS